MCQTLNRVRACLLTVGSNRTRRICHIDLVCHRFRPLRLCSLWRERPLPRRRRRPQKVSACVSPSLFRSVESLAVLTELRVLDAPVSAPVPCLDGQLNKFVDAPEGVRAVALFDEASGRSLSREDFTGWEEFGSALAQIHISKVAGEGLPTLAIAQLLLNPSKQWRTKLHAVGQTDFEVASLVEGLARLIEPVMPYLPIGLVHGDTAGGNAHMSPDGRIAFFDFMWTGIGPWCWDLGTFRRGAGEIDRNWNALCKGYESVRKLADSELAAIPILAAIRCVFTTANIIDECDLDLQAEMTVPWLDKRASELKRLCDRIPQLV